MGVWYKARARVHRAASQPALLCGFAQRTLLVAVIALVRPIAIGAVMAVWRRLASTSLVTSSLTVVTHALLAAAILAIVVRPLSAADAVRTFAPLGVTHNSDDSVSANEALGFQIAIGGFTTATIGVSTNGFLRFQGTNDGCCQGPNFSATESAPIIAPYWTDLNPGAGGNLTFGQSTLDGRNVFVATWNGVPYFGSSALTYLQAIIIDRSDRDDGDFDVEFNYNSLGSANRLTTVGISEGNTNSGNTAFLPGSGVQGSLENGGANALVDGSNVGVLGRYLFQIIDGNVRLFEPSVLWGANPASADWNTAANWSTGAVPTGADTPQFGASTITTIDIQQANTEVGGLTFNAGAPGYTFNVIGTTGEASSLNIGGIGIDNQSGNRPTFVVSGVSGNSGTLQFKNSATAGDAVIITGAFGQTLFAGTSTGGTAQLITNAGGTVDISGLTSPGLTVGSIEGAGAYVLGAKNLTTGSLNSDTEVSGDISGNGGSLTKVGAGTLTLSGTNTYTGDTTISAGILQIGSGSNSGSIAGNVVNNATLAFNRSDAVSFSGNISGTGALEQNGAGTLALTGTTSYTGATTVNAGALVVNGSIASSSGLAINNGAFVAGTGTLPNTFVGAGGTLSPGNSIGTITVNGTLQFDASSIYAIEVAPTAADMTVVTGTAVVAGTVVAGFQPGMYLAKNHTILSSAGLAGSTFGALVTANLPAGFAASLSYTNTDARLDLTAVLGTAAELPTNQQSVAGSLNNFFNNGGTLPPGFVTLFGLQGTSLEKGLTQVSGEVNTTSNQTGTQSMNSFMTLALNPFGGNPGGAPGGGPALGYARDFGASGRTLTSEQSAAYAAVTPRDARPQAVVDRTWSIWGQGYGGYNKTQGDSTAGTSDRTSRIWGFATGADHKPDANTMVGFALSGGVTSWAMAQGLGTGTSQVFQAGIYGSRRFGDRYVSAVATYAWHDTSTDRTLQIAGTDRLTAAFNAHSVGARVETGHRIAARDIVVTPYAAAQIVHFRTPSYSEQAVTGSAQFALTYEAKASTSYRTELGFWYDKTIVFGDGRTLALRGRTAWAHDFAGRSGTSATFQSLPGSTFVMSSTAAPTDLALITAGAEVTLPNRLSLGAKFDGEWAPGGQTYAGTGTLRYFW